MDINKIIARYCHTINESLIPERVMPETTTAETVRESLTELTMTLKIHDLPSVLDMVYKKLIESAAYSDAAEPLFRFDMSHGSGEN